MVNGHSGDADRVNRRRVLQSVAGASVIGVAGCLWGGDGDDGMADLDAAYERQEVDVDEIREGGTLRVGLTETVASFDPTVNPDTISMIAHGFVYESLIRTDRHGAVYPWLAERYERRETHDVDVGDYEPYMVELDHENGIPATDEQVVLTHPETDPADASGRYLTVAEAPDAVEDGTFGMQFRYDLHEGITFTDGEELTAENVVRSYERYEGSAVAGQVFDQFLFAEAVDTYTVDCYAIFPDAEAERDLPTYVFPSAHLDVPPGGIDPRQGVEPIGTGPYVFDEFVDGSHYRVEKNDDYWFDLSAKSWWDGPADWPDGPVVDAVDMEIVRTDSTRSAALQNDEIDLTFGLPGSSLTDFQRSDGYRVTASPGGSYTFIQFPVTVSPWDDADVRRAVNHLIPRSQIVENVFSGWAEPAWVPLPRVAAAAGTTDYDGLVEDLRPATEYDPDRADALLQDADVETPIEVSLETNADNDDRVRTVELIASALEDSGHFNVTISTYEWTMFATQLFSPDFYERGTLPVVLLSGTFNPGSFVEATHHPEQFAACCNFQNVDIPSLTDAIEAAQFGIDVVDDPDERARRYDALWADVLDHAANAYLHLGVEHAVTNTDVIGFNANPFPEWVLSYGLYAPMDRQLTYLNT